MLARGSLDALLATAPANLLGVSELFIDRRVVMYAVSVSLTTGAIAGLAPNILFARRSIADASRTPGSKAGSPRVRQALVVLQVAMTVVLLCGAGVLVRTRIALDRAPSADQLERIRRSDAIFALDVVSRESTR